jgi:hypothetical protein
LLVEGSPILPFGPPLLYTSQPEFLLEYYGGERIAINSTWYIVLSVQKAGMAQEKRTHYEDIVSARLRNKIKPSDYCLRPDNRWCIWQLYYARFDA